MPRQTFLTRDFFVDAPELTTREQILKLPTSISNIEFVAEDQVRHSLRFLYKGEAGDQDNIINVSLLPLTTHQTRISLQGSYADGAFIHKDEEVENVLLNVESAIHAVVGGNLATYQPRHYKTKSGGWQLNVWIILSLIIGIIYLLKAQLF